eukprot:m.176301 g.176301  ORF g.176301 m.176301 type:complete len:148 (+) comp14144_c0_seq1:31-474(+)
MANNYPGFSMWAPPPASGVHNPPTPVQDKLSPGKAAIRYKRNLPAGALTGAMIWGGSAVVMAVGFYLVIEGRHQRARLLAEKTNARAAIMPCLQAEEDRRQVRLEYQEYQAEKMIMKDVKNWIPGASVYNTNRHVPPATTVHLGEKV